MKCDRHTKRDAAGSLDGVWFCDECMLEELASRTPRRVLELETALSALLDACEPLYKAGRLPAMDWFKARNVLDNVDR